MRRVVRELWCACGKWRGKYDGCGGFGGCGGCGRCVSRTFSSSVSTSSSSSSSSSSVSSASSALVALRACAAAVCEYVRRGLARVVAEAAPPVDLCSLRSHWRRRSPPTRPCWRPRKTATSCCQALCQQCRKQPTTAFTRPPWRRVAIASRSIVRSTRPRSGGESRQRMRESRTNWCESRTIVCESRTERSESRTNLSATRAQKGATRALKKSDSTHAGTTRRGESTTRGATRGKERANSRRRVVRDGSDSPPRVGPRHYRVPRHFLRGPFLVCRYARKSW